MEKVLINWKENEKEICFATNNAHKLEEVTAILGDKIELLSMKDIHCSADIPRNSRYAALLKARYIFENYHLDCFADDTGLEVEALNGEPGRPGDAHNSPYAKEAYFLPSSRIWKEWRTPRTVSTYRQWKGTSLFEGIVKAK